MPLHANSLAAFASLDIDERSRLCLAAYLDSAVPLTDRQCMHVLGFQEKNRVSPRITTLTEDGFLEEVGSTICEETGKRVRLSRPTVKARA